MHHIFASNTGVLMGPTASAMHAAHSPDSMRRSIIWTSPTQAAAWSGVRRSWSYKVNGKWSVRSQFTGFADIAKATWWWHPVLNRISINIIHTSALTSSFLCNNNWTSSALRLKMAWTRGGCKTIEKYLLGERDRLERCFQQTLRYRCSRRTIRRSPPRYKNRRITSQQAHTRRYVWRWR